ncbi:hypothetical protein AB0B92_02335 [Streptomyces hygroscopicus]|uniref:hypothetical protein n=1 Tax=Streptomyces hygroscopicus TaxID=1912 RepID=UPI0033E9AAF9
MARPRTVAVLAIRVPAHALRVDGGLRTEAARVLLTGVAAHGIGRLPAPASAAVALLLGHLAHTTGWPVPRRPCAGAPPGRRRGQPGRCRGRGRRRAG